MCRRNELCGCALITFGLGLLIGILLESGFISSCIGLVFIGLGFWCGKKK
jgi:hypothetical protein